MHQSLFGSAFYLINWDSRMGPALLLWVGSLSKSRAEIEFVSKRTNDPISHAYFDQWNKNCCIN